MCPIFYAAAHFIPIGITMYIYFYTGERGCFFGDIGTIRERCASGKLAPGFFGGRRIWVKGSGADVSADAVFLDVFLPEKHNDFVPSDNVVVFIDGIRLR